MSTPPRRKTNEEARKTAKKHVPDRHVREHSAVDGVITQGQPIITGSTLRDLGHAAIGDQLVADGNNRACGKIGPTAPESGWQNVHKIKLRMNP
ncbi:hypothetical protein ABTW72_17320 [Micromonospora sp. NPDC127501]|uniref:hypothetical protein n=1 Tax=Micromonospora sp. NPDC127501 TaxID=3154872 RepID=UPI003317B030